MQYCIEAIDTDGMHHKQGVGRSWHRAVKCFQMLTAPQPHLQFIRSAKLVMVTDSGKKLDTIIRYQPQQQARVA